MHLCNPQCRIAFQLVRCVHSSPGFWLLQMPGELLPVVPMGLHFQTCCWPWLATYFIFCLWDSHWRPTMVLLWVLKLFWLSCIWWLDEGTLWLAVCSRLVRWLQMKNAIVLPRLCWTTQSQWRHCCRTPWARKGFWSFQWIIWNHGMQEIHECSSSVCPTPSSWQMLGWCFLLGAFWHFLRLTLCGPLVATRSFAHQICLGANGHQWTLWQCPERFGGAHGPRSRCYNCFTIHFFAWRRIIRPWQSGSPDMLPFGRFQGFRFGSRPIHMFFSDFPNVSSVPHTRRTLSLWFLWTFQSLSSLVLFLILFRLGAVVLVTRLWKARLDKNGRPASVVGAPHAWTVLLHNLPGNWSVSIMIIISSSSRFQCSKFQFSLFDGPFVSYFAFIWFVVVFVNCTFIVWAGSHHVRQFGKYWHSVQWLVLWLKFA